MREKETGREKVGRGIIIRGRGVDWSEGSKLYSL